MNMLFQLSGYPVFPENLRGRQGVVLTDFTVLTAEAAGAEAAVAVLLLVTQTTVLTRAAAALHQI